MNLNLYLISQDVNNGYDTYDSIVVAAGTPDSAKQLTCEEYHTDAWSPWASFEDLEAELIGVADPKYTKPEVILASFNAG